MMRAEVVIARCGKRPLIGETQRIIQREGGVHLPGAGAFLAAVIGAERERDRYARGTAQQNHFGKAGLLARLNIDSHLLRRQAVELLHALLNIAQIQYVTNQAGKRHLQRRRLLTVLRNGLDSPFANADGQHAAGDILLLQPGLRSDIAALQISIGGFVHQTVDVLQRQAAP